MVDVKRRRITAKDWSVIESYISGELERRKQNSFRKDHERIWSEVDRQVAMKPMRRIVNNKEVEDWHSTIELGELSKASEIITADVLRMIFPHSRAWFDPHIEMTDPAMQKPLDGALRAVMSQQHIDFGFKSRFELSLKEALHHGSFVAEAIWESRLKVAYGSRVENISAPVWQPHSMWNCYPDPSPQVIGTDMFYNGSMIIVSWASEPHVRGMAVGDGWMNVDQIPSKGKDKDIELVTYYGDLTIPRQDGDIHLPNCKSITANGKIIYYSPLPMPYIPIIYTGYERQDIRDPYYTSPIVKLSPMQKLGSVMANKFIESIALKIEPPIVYDANDSYFAMSGGPLIAPGARNPTKGAADWKSLDVGDPTAASAGLEMAIRQIQEGTGVNAVRAGGLSSDRKTATEIAKTSQAGEIRTVDFVDKLERGGLRPFLYMQHTLNRLNMKEYSFYNSEMDAPDFMRARKADLPETVHFDVVGSKGLLGEEERTQKTSAVTAFASGNPLFASLLKPDTLLKEMYQDAGNKNPERFLNVQGQTDPQVQAIQQQAQQVIQQLQAKIQELESGLQAETIKMQGQMQIKQAELQVRQQEIEQKAQQAEAELLLKRQIAEAELDLKHRSSESDLKSRERIELARLGVKAQEEVEGPGVMEQLVEKMSETAHTGRSGNESLAQSIAAMVESNNAQTQMFMQGLKQIADEMGHPKRLIRDSSGRPVGVEKAQ